MVNGIILTVNLVGKVGASIPTEEVVSIRINGLTLTKSICYQKKEATPCVRKTNVSGEVVSEWIGNKPSNGIKPIIWARMSKTQRLRSYLDMMDEGFGYSFEAL